MLSAKHQHFVDEYCIDRNASRAARAAGYSAASAKVTASRLLTNANVRAAVTVRELEAELVLEVTRDGVLAALWAAFELAKQQNNPAAMIAACKAISAMCGYDKPQRHQVELTADASGYIAHMEKLSDRQLAELAMG